MRAEGKGLSVEVQGLSQAEADQAARYLEAMSLALQQIALTDDADSLVSLWMGYYTNLKNLEQMIPPAWEPPPDSAFVGE
jgi:hypothetical protein